MYFICKNNSPLAIDKATNIQYNVGIVTTRTDSRLWPHLFYLLLSWFPKMLALTFCSMLAFPAYLYEFFLLFWFPNWLFSGIRFRKKHLNLLRNIRKKFPFLETKLHNYYFHKSWSLSCSHSLGFFMCCSLCLECLALQSSWDSFDSFFRSKVECPFLNEGM